MDLDTELDLREAAERLGVTAEKLIRWGANSKLAITVIADDWTIRTESGAVGSISGPANLVPKDLEQSFNADITLVREVATLDDGEVLTLDEPIELRRGMLFVTANEFRRFRSKYAGFVGRGDGIPPYLDDSHHWYSPKLAAAVQAWTALFADGNFQKGPKGVIDQIESWLMSNTDDLSPTARGYISKVVNPKKTKDGGAPPIPVK